jgi:hypothetical protein
LDVAEDVRRGERTFIPRARGVAALDAGGLCRPARRLSAAARLLLGWMQTALTDIGNAPVVRGRMTRKKRGVLR